MANIILLQLISACSEYPSAEQLYCGTDKAEASKKAKQAYDAYSDRKRWDVDEPMYDVDNSAYICETYTLQVTIIPATLQTVLKCKEDVICQNLPYKNTDGQIISLPCYIGLTKAAENALYNLSVKDIRVMTLRTALGLTVSTEEIDQDEFRALVKKATNSQIYFI